MKRLSGCLHLYLLFVLNILTSTLFPAFSQSDSQIPEETLDYIIRAADGDHLALEGGHLALDGHVMPYPFFEKHEILYLYRLSQLRHEVVWKADSLIYRPGWDPENPKKSAQELSGEKVPVSFLAGERLSHESYWFTIPELPVNTSGRERFLCLRPMEMSLPGWPETTIYLNGEAKAALMRQHFYWSTDALFDETVENQVCLKSFGIFDHPRGYKEVSVVERNAEVDELYWYLRVLIEATSIIEEGQHGFTEMTHLKNDIMSSLDLDIGGTTKFEENLKSMLPEIESRFKAIEQLSDSDFTLRMLNHGHLDSAWRWTLKDTDEKLERLVLNNLYLMDRYPEYKYVFTSPYHYERLKELYPDLYIRVREKISSGQWIANGSTYIENDMNLPGAESIVRQFLYGLSFYESELDVKNNTLFLPDTFGYPRFLPQVVKGFGLDHLIGMRVNTDEIDHSIYRWQGIDGSQILVNGLTTPAWEYPFVDAVHDYRIKNPYHYTTYNAPDPGPRRLKGTKERFKDEKFTNEQIMLIGWGDGGGGGTEDQIELKRKGSSLPSFPRVEWTTLHEYVKDQTLNSEKFPVFDKRILPSRWIQRTFLMANGIKMNNRKVEQSLREAESLSVMASRYGMSYPDTQLRKIWKDLLVHHFHDIITGMAVPEVLSKANETLIELNKQALSLRDKSLEVIAENTTMESDGLLVFNPSGTYYTGLVRSDNLSGHKTKLLLDEQGNVVETHWGTGGELYFQVSRIQPMSFAKYYWSDEEVVSKPNEMKVSRRLLENSLVRVTFDDNGEITSFFDKEVGRELVPEDKTWNRFLMFNATEGGTLMEASKRNPKQQVSAFKDAEIEIAESNDLTVGLRIHRTFKSSAITQRVNLYKGSKQLVFDTEMTWNEKSRLEADFPVDLVAEYANHGIQWGMDRVERSKFKATDSLHQPICAHQWADISEKNYGIALMDRTRYGYQLKDGGMRLILSYMRKRHSYPELKNVHWDEEGSGDQGGNNFKYAIFPHLGGAVEAKVAQNAMMFNTDLIVLDLEQKKQGDSRSSQEITRFLQGLPDNIILQSVKREENGSGTILRLYETEMRSARVELTTGIGGRKIFETNLKEDIVKELKAQDGKFDLHFKPFEIKTILIKD